MAPDDTIETWSLIWETLMSRSEANQDKKLMIDIEGTEGVNVGITIIEHRVSEEVAEVGTTGIREVEEDLEVHLDTEIGIVIVNGNLHLKDVPPGDFWRCRL